MSTATKMPQLPKLVVETITADNLAGQKERRAAGARVSEKQIRVPFDKIVIRKFNNKKSFNIREDFGDLEELATSITNLGLIKPLEGDVVDEGQFVLTDGERRYRAIATIRERSDELRARFEFVDFIVHDRRMSDEERIAAMLVSGNGKPYEPLEEAEGFRRLRDDYQMGLPRIHELTGKSVPYIEQRLILADATADEKHEIKSGNIKPTTYVQLVRKEPDPEKRMKRIEKSTSTGKRLKVKDIKNDPVAFLCTDAKKFIKLAMKRTNDGEIINLLIEADARLNEIKQIVEG